MKKDSYTTPAIKTVDARTVVNALGPASAGSGNSASSKDGFKPNTSSCGFPMGQPCP